MHLGHAQLLHIQLVPSHSYSIVIIVAVTISVVLVLSTVCVISVVAVVYLNTPQTSLSKVTQILAKYEHRVTRNKQSAL